MPVITSDEIPASDNLVQKTCRRQQNSTNIQKKNWNDWEYQKSHIWECKLQRTSSPWKAFTAIYTKQNKPRDWVFLSRKNYTTLNKRERHSLDFCGLETVSIHLIQTLQVLHRAARVVGWRVLQVTASKNISSQVTAFFILLIFKKHLASNVSHPYFYIFPAIHGFPLWDNYRNVWIV